MLAVLLASLAVAASAAETYSSEALAKMDDLARMSSGDLASLTDENFDRLARSGDRPYHLFVLFNAKSPQFQCALCGPFEDEIDVVRDSFARQVAKDGNAPKIFFARAEYTHNQRVFKDYNTQSVPMLVHYSPTGPGGTHSKTKFVQGSQYMGELDAENAALFVRERTDYRVEVYRSPWGRIITALVFFGSIGAFAYYFTDSIGSLIQAVRGFTPLWFAVGLAMYYISVSGVLYDIIRGVPFVGYDARTRRAVVVAPSSGMQYGLEGCIAGALNLAGGAAVIVLAKFLPRFKQQSEKVTVCAVSGAVFFIAFNLIRRMYIYKNQWYDSA